MFIVTFVDFGPVAIISNKCLALALALALASSSSSSLALALTRFTI